MAHNINTMMYVGERPWHGLGRELKEPATAAQAIEAAGLNWNTQSEEVFVKRNGQFVAIEGKRAVSRVDTGDVFNVMSDGYQAINNNEAFGFFDSIVGEGKAIYHTAGALGTGERVWIMAKLPQDIMIDGTADKLEKFLLLVNSHDGTCALRMFFTPIRVVCQNTLQLALGGRGKGEGISVRHTKNATEAVGEARRALGLALKYYDTFERVANTLASKKASVDAVKNYFHSLVPDNPKASNNARTENIRTMLMDHYRQGIGNDMPGVSGTWWAAVNSVTQFVDHDRATRGRTAFERMSNKLHSNWFGTGARLKAEAWDLALDLANVKVDTK